MCNQIFEYGILRFECVTRFEYSNQIRMCHEIRIFQPDSNVSRDSNIPTRFEYHTRFEYAYQIRICQPDSNIRISYEIKILWMKRVWEVIHGMTGFKFGTEQEITNCLSRKVNSKNICYQVKLWIYHIRKSIWIQCISPLRK